LDEISQGPKRDSRLPSGRWLMPATAAGLAAAVATVVLTGGGGRHAAVPPEGAARQAGRAPSLTAAPGTVLLTCDSANGGALGSHWRSRSLRAGPLWFLYGRQQGYVHERGWRAAGRVTQRSGKRHIGVMIVEVTPGSTVVMKAVPAASPYFRFVDGFGSVADNKRAAGEPGFTFVACPRGHGGRNGRVTDFYLSFSIEAGRAAPVEIWPSAGSRPIRVIFTLPRPRLRRSSGQATGFNGTRRSGASPRGEAPVNIG
jgi:hypothetical protein